MIKRIHYKSKYSNIISIIYQIIFPHIQAFKPLAKMIFKVDAYSKHRYTKWDLCTLVSKKALDIYAKKNHRVLEIGPSDIGILCMYLANKIKNIDITGVDISHDFIENAIRNAEKNNLKIKYFQSDLFLNVEGSFDIIFFNPPYNPTEWGQKYQNKFSEKASTTVWDGGTDSYDMIRRFSSDVSEYLAPDGKVLIGTTLFFQEDSKLKEIFIQTNLDLISTVSSVLNPSIVYVLTKKT
jgi:HemK-related putative methylase